MPKRADIKSIALAASEHLFPHAEDTKTFTEPANMSLNNLSGKIIELSIKIHRALGPGLLESAYHRCLEYELQQSRIAFMSEAHMPVTYEKLHIESGYIADLIVDNRIIVELKSVEKIHDIHKSQILTYLKMSGMQLGLLINFKEPLLKNGLHRFINSGSNHHAENTEIAQRTQ